MMLKKFSIALAGASIATLASVYGASAATFSGSIEYDSTLQRSTIDQWYFDVEQPGNVSIAATATSGNLDTYIRLYTDDGSLDFSDQIAFNDDGGPGLNSFLTQFLNPGNYVVNIGDFFLEADAFGPTQFEGFFPGFGDYILEISGATVTRVLEGNLNETFTQTSFTDTSFEQAIVNGSFEEGFTGWSTIGDTSIEDISFGTPPSDGNFNALITNGFGAVSDFAIESFLGLTPGTLDSSLDIIDATEGSAIKQTFFAKAGDILTFDFNFLTDEFTPDFFFNDSSFYISFKFRCIS
ncbi:hypothetical protein [Okeania sp. KiyG1]|uniref:hypothetical protein n=1 Tax=Okeania sp. KiyG1 TaxID=2720165 RepID=UPI001922E9CA|nr:hypothetical protein [Okeania sp. KiyG1]GGA04414.1 hypothetical protein CYANOKiyG1_16800 [Okeania sp. KiyG1]